MKKLICFDMDGVIFRARNFWMELHKAYGTFEEGKILTEKYLHSDYDTLVKEVVQKLWKGMPEDIYLKEVNSYEYLPGVKETFDYIKSKGYLTAIISASSVDVANRVKNDFRVDFVFGNKLVFKDGVVSGEFEWPVGAGNEAKAKIVRDLCSSQSIGLEDVVFVGDSKNDVEAFKEVGVSIAFNCDYSPLKEIATHVVDSENLGDVIKYLD